MGLGSASLALPILGRHPGDLSDSLGPMWRRVLQDRPNDRTNDDSLACLSRREIGKLQVRLPDNNWLGHYLAESAAQKNRNGAFVILMVGIRMDKLMEVGRGR